MSFPRSDGTIPVQNSTGPRIEVRDPNAKDSILNLMFEKTDATVWYEECRGRRGYLADLRKTSEQEGEPGMLLDQDEEEEDDRMVFCTDVRTSEVFRVEKVGDDLTPQELKDHAEM